MLPSPFRNLSILLFSHDEATLYERVSVRWSVGPSVRPSFTLSLFGLLGATYAVYTALFTSLLNDINSAGRERKGDKEEGGTRRKERRGGRSDETSEKMNKL